MFVFQRGAFNHGDHTYSIAELHDDVDETGAQTVVLDKHERVDTMNDTGVEIKFQDEDMQDFHEQGIEQLEISVDILYLNVC